MIKPYYDEGDIKIYHGVRICNDILPIKKEKKSNEKED